MRFSWWIPLCALVYAVMLESAAWADLAVGLALGVVLSVLQRRSSRTTVVLRPWRIPRLVAHTIVEVARGTTKMIRLVLGPGVAEHAAVVEIDRGARSDAAVALSGLLATLNPGTVFLCEDRERRKLLFHVVDASDPEAVRATLQRAYEEIEAPVLDVRER